MIPGLLCSRTKSRWATACFPPRRSTTCMLSDSISSSTIKCISATSNSAVNRLILNCPPRSFLSDPSSKTPPFSSSSPSAACGQGRSMSAAASSDVKSVCCSSSFYSSSERASLCRSILPVDCTAIYSRLQHRRKVNKAAQTAGMITRRPADSVQHPCLSPSCLSVQESRKGASPCNRIISATQADDNDDHAEPQSKQDDVSDSNLFCESSSPFSTQQDFVQSNNGGDRKQNIADGVNSNAAGAVSTSSREDVPSKANRPKMSQLRRHFLFSMIPMMGFGFMDNIIMLQAGEFIDTSIGVVFGISTLTAAACGQVLSDVCGVLFGGLVATLAAKWWVLSNDNDLSRSQQKLAIVQWTGLMGRLVGVVAGCMLGMTSLLFMDLEESQRLKRFRELQPILVTIVHQTKRSLGTESCRIYMLGVRRGSSEELLFEVGGDIADSDHARGQIADSLKSFYHQKSPIDLGQSNSRILHFILWLRHKLNHQQTTSPVIPRGSSRSGKIPIIASSDRWVVAEAGRSINERTAADEVENYTYQVISSTSRPTHMLRHFPKGNPEAVVSYVTRTGHAVLCVHRDAHTALGRAPQDTIATQLGRESRIITVQMEDEPPLAKTLLCYPVFDDLEKDKVIGVIELANKRGADGNLLPFAREDERLVKMLSEHLSLYLALGSHYDHQADNPLDNVNRIAWLCPA